MDLSTSHSNVTSQIQSSGGMHVSDVEIVLLQSCTGSLVMFTSVNIWSTATATFFSSQRKLSAKEAGFSGTLLGDAEASCKADTYLD